MDSNVKFIRDVNSWRRHDRTTPACVRASETSKHPPLDGLDVQRSSGHTDLQISKRSERIDPELAGSAGGQQFREREIFLRT